MKNDAKFWNKIARRYAKSKIGNMAAYNQTMDRVRGYLAPQDQVLEVGCGTGSTALLLAGHVGQITGSDISSEMIAIAREKGAADAVQNVEFVVSPAIDALFQPASFDAVLAFNLLHLVEDVPATARRAREVLKPGGLYLSKTPCLGEMTIFLRLLLPLMQLIGKAPFAAFPTKASLERDIENAGFKIVEACTFERAKKTWFIAARKT